MFIQQFVCKLTLWLVLNQLIVFKHSLGEKKGPLLNCTCGEVEEEEVTVRVKGGAILRPMAHPSLALIMLMDTLLCGGTVVGPHHVLTAGHCLEGVYLEEKLMVYLGVHDRLTLDDDKVKKYNVKEIIRHNEFEILEKNIIINDIALLRVDKIDFGKHIKPICLPFNIGVSRYKAAAVAGWGRTEYKGLSSRLPRVTLLSVLKTRQCEKSSVDRLLKNVPQVYEMMLCAYKRDRDACQGDSGGPLYIKKDDEFAIQIGIVSFGVKCGSKGIPGLYTKVVHYLDWLDTNMGGGYCHLPETN